MCAVSAIIDYYFNKPLTDWSWTVYHDYIKLVKAIKKDDEANNKPDCEKDVSDQEEKVKRYLTATEGPQPE